MLTTPAPNRSKTACEGLDLVRYLALFDLDLGEVNPEQVSMFIAARAAAEYVDDLAIPIATRPKPDEESTLREIETELPMALTGYVSDPVGGELPSNDMDVTTIQSTEQLARIFPTQWLLEDVCPDAFYAKVAQRELLMPEWQRPTQKPEDSYDESPDHERIEDRVLADTPKQHAYLLLDTSRTMSDHDRRGPVARGLALAFLLKGYQQRSQLNFRPFADQAADLSSGTSRDEFRNIVRRVIDISNGGQTRIQQALEQAVLDVRKAGPCLRADVMLISDGISRLTGNPFRGEHLHTFLVGDLMAEDESTGIIRTLRDWSRTFRRVWKSRFQEILAPTIADVQAANRQLLAQAKAATDEDAARLHQMIENVKHLAAELKRAAGKKAPVPPELQAIERELAANEKQLPPPPASPMPADAVQNSNSRVAMESSLTSGTALAPAGQSLGLWKLLRHFVARVWQMTIGRVAWVWRRP
ncbi:MAG: VWA domain-containing protein [Planctomycetaceae bacterium]|nr:VWA domain-containing protein [Planctomycetaceae bacterium]